MSAAARAVPSGEFAFDAENHAAIAKLAYDEAGIVLPAAKAQLVYGRLARRVRARGLDGFNAYIALLDRDAAERVRAIDALTTNHTGFFRESHHFDHFVAHCWPALRKRLDEGGRVRLWSAACSSGEEPYTLAMAMLGGQRPAARTLGAGDVKILATDLSTDILETARAARYPLDTVKTVPSALRARWFEQAGAEAALRPEVRALVAFHRLNLMGDWPMRGRFDVIFCRNVMIYFDEPTKARLQARLADQLVPDGFLYIGHSERLAADVAPRFESLGRTMYRKRAA